LGLFGKSDEGIVALKSGNADGAKALWLMFVDAKCRGKPCLEEIPKGHQTIELKRKLAEKPNGKYTFVPSRRRKGTKGIP